MQTRVDTDAKQQGEIYQQTRIFRERSIVDHDVRRRRIAMNGQRCWSKWF